MKVQAVPGYFLKLISLFFMHTVFFEVQYHTCSPPQKSTHPLVDGWGWMFACFQVRDIKIILSLIRIRQFALQNNFVALLMISTNFQWNYNKRQFYILNFPQKLRKGLIVRKLIPDNWMKTSTTVLPNSTQKENTHKNDQMWLGMFFLWHS